MSVRSVCPPDTLINLRASHTVGRGIELESRLENLR